MYIIILGALLCTKVIVFSYFNVHVHYKYSYFSLYLDDPSLNSTTLSAKHPHSHYTIGSSQPMYENNGMQSSPGGPHQVYYKSEPQYGWPASALDYNPAVCYYQTVNLLY